MAKRAGLGHGLLTIINRGMKKVKILRVLSFFLPASVGGANAFLTRQKILPGSDFNQKVEKITRRRCIK